MTIFTALLLPLPTTQEWGEDRGEGQSKRTNAPLLPNPLRHRMEEKECFGCGRAAPELRGFIRIFRLPFRVDRIDLAL